jgi:hypothetical protein
VPFLQSFLGPWTWFSDSWLVSRQAVRLFLVATIFVLALTPVALGVVDPAEMSLPMRLLWTIVGMIGTVSLFFLWLGMWRYWVRIDRSNTLKKRFWFAILFLGFWYGSCLYYFFEYRSQVLRDGMETYVPIPARVTPGFMFRRILIAAWALFLACIALVFLLRPKPDLWAPFVRAAPLVLALLLVLSFAYGVSRIYRQGMRRSGRR